MPRVLILEDESVLRISMVRAIAKLPTIEVSEAGTYAQAIEQMNKALPDMIIADLDLPDKSGLELIGELAKRGHSIPMVYISAYLKAYGSQIPPNANIEVRDKPVEMSELKRMVREKLDIGQESAFSVTDYLQLAIMSGRSVHINVETTEGGTGQLAISSGQIWSATDSFGEGKDAFKRLAFGQHASITTEPFDGELGERNLEGSAEALLMDAAREEDEISSVEPSPDLEFDVGEPSGEQADPLNAAIAAKDFDAIWGIATDALFDKNYACAYTALKEAKTIQPENKRVDQYLQRVARKIEEEKE